MKKKLWKLSIILICISCANQNSSFISSSLSSSQELSSSISSLQSEEIYPSNKDELTELINKTSLNYTLEKESKFTYTKTEYPQKYSFEDYYFKKEEKLVSQRFKESFASQKMTVKKEQSKNQINFDTIYSFSGYGYIGNFEEKQILLKYYDTSKVPESEYIAQENLLTYLTIDEGKSINNYITSNLSYLVVSYLQNINQDFEKPIKNDDDTLTYYLNGESIINQDRRKTYELELTFSIDKSIKEATFTYKSYNYDWGKGSFDSNTYEHIVEHYKCEYSSIESGETSNIVNPNDYILKDAEIGFIEQNSYDGALLNNNAIKCGTYLKPKTISTTPRTAINNTFSIISSSNEAVVQNTGYSWKCVNIGTTTLTLENNDGFKKEIKITVFAPDLESINISLPGDKFYVGEKYFINISNNPYDSISTYNVTSSNNNIAEIINENNSFYINCKQNGTITIHVESIEFPSIKTSLTVTIEEAPALGDNATLLINNLWYCYSYSTYSYYYLSFNEDGTGKIYDDYYYVNETFTYVVNNNIVTLSELYIYYDYSYTTFVDNKITIDESKTKLHLSLFDGFYTYMIETFEIYN